MTEQYGHTRGDLYVDENYIGGISIKGEEHEKVVAFLPSAYGLERKTAQVNGERLVTCWNALEGIPTDLIDAYVAAARKSVTRSGKVKPIAIYWRNET